MLDLAALRVLREVGRTGSFGQAAQVLSYTPPAVSQRIAALEREYDVLLFERSARGATPTAAGRLLLAHAEHLLQAAEIAEADLAAAAGYRRGRVRLGTFATAAAGFVVSALATARTELGLDVEVVEAEPYVLLPRVIARELDVAVVFRYPGQAASMSFEGRASADETRLTRIGLCDDPLVVVMPRDHPLGERATVRRSEVRDETFVPVSPLMPTFPAVERHLGFRPRFAAVETADYQVVLGVVAAGLGLALVPRTVVAQARRDDVVARPLAGQQINRRVEVALAAESDHSPVIDALVDALVAAAVNGGRLAR